LVNSGREDHNDFVVLRCDNDLVCPVRALEEYYCWCKTPGEDITKGYVFRLFPVGNFITRMNSDMAYKQLKSHLRAIGIDEGETPMELERGIVFPLY
jgi:hypothetical protein